MMRTYQFTDRPPEYYEVDLSQDPNALYDCTMDAVEALEILLKRYNSTAVEALYKQHQTETNWLNLSIRPDSMVFTRFKEEHERFKQDYARLKEKIKILENLLACSQDSEAYSHLYVLMKKHIECNMFHKMGIIFYFIEKNPQHPSALMLRAQIEQQLTAKLTKRINTNKLTPYQPSDTVLRFSNFSPTRLSTPSPAHTSSPVPMTNTPPNQP